MRRVSIPITLLATVGLAVATYAVSTRTGVDRPDCPGKIICPLTGRLICKDRCPLQHNGTDRLNETTAGALLPVCCRGKN